MRAWQLLLDWYTPAERNPLTSCAVALCREVPWVTGQTHNGKKVLATSTRPNKLHDCKLTIFPLTFERYISLPFRVGGLGVSWWFHHYMPDSSPWPLKDTYHYHLGWGGCGEYPDGSSEHDDDDDDDVDVDDDDDDDHCESGQTMASDRNATTNFGISWHLWTYGQAAELRTQLQPPPIMAQPVANDWRPVESKDRWGDNTPPDTCRRDNNTHILVKGAFTSPKIGI